MMKDGIIVMLEVSVGCWDTQVTRLLYQTVATNLDRYRRNSAV